MQRCLLAPEVLCVRAERTGGREGPAWIFLWLQSNDGLLERRYRSTVRHPQRRPHRRGTPGDQCVITDHFRNFDVCRRVCVLDPHSHIINVMRCVCVGEEREGEVMHCNMQPAQGGRLQAEMLVLLQKDTSTASIRGATTPWQMHAERHSTTFVANVLLVCC